MVFFRDDASSFCAQLCAGTPLRGGILLSLGNSIVPGFRGYPFFDGQDPVHQSFLPLFIDTAALLLFAGK